MANTTNTRKEFTMNNDKIFITANIFKSFTIDKNGNPKIKIKEMAIDNGTETPQNLNKSIAIAQAMSKMAIDKKAIIEFRSSCCNNVNFAILFENGLRKS